MVDATTVFPQLIVALAYSMFAFAMWRARNMILSKPILILGTTLFAVHAVCVVGDLVINCDHYLYFPLYFLHVSSSALAFALAWKFAEFVKKLQTQKGM